MGISAMTTMGLNVTFLTFYLWKFSENKLRPLPNSLVALLHPADVKEYLGISGPSIVLLCAEMWATELLLVLSTFLSVGQIGAAAISYNFYCLVYQFPYGFQIGAVAVIGNIIGEENK